MNPAHRDRIAFVRVCSGRFERGMEATCARTDKPVTTKHAATVFGAERDTIEEAFPGDVIGLVNASGLRLGDTLYAERPVVFPGIPRFVPEVFATARPLDIGRFKQFRRGLGQLDEEGVVQVLRDPDLGDTAPMLAAVGPLQFEVFAYRLANEFGAPIELSSTPYQAIRRTDTAERGAATGHERHPSAQPQRRQPRRLVREHLPPATTRERPPRHRASLTPRPGLREIQREGPDTWRCRGPVLSHDRSGRPRLHEVLVRVAVPVPLVDARGARRSRRSRRGRANCPG